MVIHRKVPKKEYCFEKNHNNVLNIGSEWSMDNSSKKYQQIETKDKNKYKVILQFPIEKENNSMRIKSDVKNIMEKELKRFFENIVLY